ncbi:MAG: glycosyl hydrolase family 43 [Clostridiales bacterium]|nr:glycosyl hydrolase family 43 [Clostridiales bacterium]
MNNYIYNEVNMTETFRNPITESGADPFVVRFEDGYYYVYSADGGVFVSRADNIHHLRQDGKCIFRPEEGKPYSRELWAPEIHFIDGDWYCYVAADDGVNANHHMYVLKSTDGRPDGVYAMVGMLDDGSGCWAIDGTVMPCGGKLYFVWSGWESRENTHQNLYIAPMKSPTELAGARVLLSRPEYDWEKRGSGPTKSGKCLPTVNEGPQILEKDGTVHVIYSAAGSWCRHYCLGMLTLRGGDPLNPADWVKCKEPVFVESEGTHGPGHCSFVKAKDGKTDFIIYHARRDAKGGWVGRGMRAQPFTWDGDVPVFGAAATPDDDIEIPV